jgi:hypothetical protein
MSTTTRLYIVERVGIEAVGPRLVDAYSGPAAVSHVVRPIYKARIASAKEVATLVASGVQVEDARIDHAQTDLLTGAEGGGE